MKNYFIYLVVLICLSTTNCSQKNKTFTLKGKINGVDSGNIVLGIRTDSMIIYDTSKILNGKFLFRGTIKEPIGVTLIADNNLNRVDMYIEPRTMNLTLSMDNFNDFKLTGSKTQEEFELLKKEHYPLNVIIDSLQHEKSRNQDSLDNATNVEFKNEIILRIEKLDKQIDYATNDIFEINYNFIKTHPKSFLSPHNIISLHQIGYLSLDSTKQEYKNLDLIIQESDQGYYLSRYIRKEENILVGGIAPDFKAVGLNNQVFTLSQFRNNNVVLIEFWASWCRPCRSSFPFLKSIFDKYNDKGFVIIAISNFDISKDTWISAIQQDGIDNWLHAATIFQNDEPINSAILNDYQLLPIPLSLLINKEGKIIGSWKGYYPEIEKELEKLLDESLNTADV